MTEKFDYLSSNMSDYLSDEELELLIADVEQNELVVAPPDMLEEILELVRENETDTVAVPDAEKNTGNRKTAHSVKTVTNIREFRRYCFKVCASVAAAVVLVLVLPTMSENSAGDMSEQERFIKESRYATKEEALNDQGYLMEKLGGTNIFSKEREIGIFNGKREDE